MRQSFDISMFPKVGEIPAEVDLPQPLEQREFLLDGRLETWNGEVQDVTSAVQVVSSDGPTPKRIGSCPVLDEATAQRALEVVGRAWNYGLGDWPTAGVEERIRRVEAFAADMQRLRDEVVRLMMWEICKPLSECYVEFDRTIKYIHDSVDAVKELDRTSSRLVIEQGIYAQIRRAPLGPVLCMGPYNYPLNETFTTLIPAVLMGNPVIVKTPRLGKLLFAPLLEALRDNFPPGVVNLLFGDRRIVQPMLRSGRISVLAFIGSHQAADALRRLHPQPHRLRCVLGLDAKNPAIILPSADMDLTVREVLSGALSYSGQRCTALKIIFCHSSRMDELLRGLNEGIRNMPMGMPWEDGVKITPLPVPGKAQYLSDMVAEVVAKGGHVANENGGTVAETLFYPAVVTPVAPSTRAYQEEQFGPVIPVLSYDDIHTPIDYILTSNYGQQLSLFGTDPDRMAELVDPLVNQTCRVNINSQCQRGPDTFPFTGRKDSAEGTLSVSDGLRCFSIRTLVAAKGTEANKTLIDHIIRGRKSTFLSTDFIM